MNKLFDIISDFIFYTIKRNPREAEDCCCDCQYNMDCICCADCAAFQFRIAEDVPND
jgi:hypothetical protein